MNRDQKHSQFPNTFLRVNWQLQLLVTVMLSTGWLAGCGGGGGGSASNAAQDPPMTPPPTSALAITSQPLDSSVASKGSATLSIATNGTAPTFQWYLNGIAVLGATSNAYTIGSASMSDTGSYYVMVTDLSGAKLTSKTVGLTLSTTDGSGGDTSGRVAVAAIGGPVVAMPTWDKSWQVSYKFVTPPLPAGQSWNYQQDVFYVWGDIDFDAYGAGGQYKISGYKFNQIVPQVMIGRVLSDSDSSYSPSGSSQSTWVIQAQYFWQKDATPFAQVGKLIAVNPGDLLVPSRTIA